MSDEAILIVDDDPMSVKLMRALLTGEGYSIRSAESADEALAVLETFVPRLVLMDIQLPGVDGLELTRLLRANPAMSETRIVALTAYAMKGDEQKALSAGCDGYITKPIEPSALPGLVRGFLKPEGKESAPTMGGDTEDLLSELRNNLLAEGMAEIPRLVASSAQAFETGKARRFFHRWAGIAGTLGYPQITRKARKLEELLAQPVIETWETLRAGMEDLMACFSKAACGKSPSRVWPRDVVACLSGKRLALIGFERAESERMARVLRQTQAFTETLDTATPGAEDLATYDMLVVKLSADGASDPWIDPEQLENNTEPLLVIGPCEALLRQDGTVRKNSPDFLIAPWDPEEVVLRAYRLLSKAPRRRPAAGGAAGDAQPIVVIADDDPAVTRLVSATLERFHVDCRVACNGNEALQLVKKFQPSAVVLDINMPDLDGFAVQMRMRMEQASRRIPVVLLTGRREETDVMRGFGYGAADYVIKPFNPLELAARVIRLIDWPR